MRSLAVRGIHRALEVCNDIRRTFNSNRILVRLISTPESGNYSSETYANHVVVDARRHALLGGKLRLHRDERDNDQRLGIP